MLEDITDSCIRKRYDLESSRGVKLVGIERFTLDTTVFGESADNFYVLLRKIDEAILTAKGTDGCLHDCILDLEKKKIPYKIKLQLTEGEGIVVVEIYRYGTNREVINSLKIAEILNRYSKELISFLKGS